MARKFYLDTEFIEGFHKPFLGKRRHFIDLISIALVCEDGREYYAISNEFSARKASQWVKDNVISKLPPRWSLPDASTMSPEAGMYIVPIECPLYKSNKQIAREIIDFVNYNPIDEVNEGEYTFSTQRYGSFAPMPKPEFYAYYADYDWVLFCSLFGTMMELPEGFPMYCIDLKQILDQRIETMLFSQRMKFDILGTTDRLLTLEEKIENVKKHPSYPKQADEHDALADARWNKELYQFVSSFGFLS